MAKKSKRDTGEGQYQIVGTVSRDGKRGETTYHDVVFYTPSAKDDADAVQQWKLTLSKAVKIIKYTVIFMGLIGLVIAMLGAGVIR